MPAPKAIEPVFPLKRKKYTAEFRQEAVRRMLAGASGEQVARDLGISPSMAHNWRNKFMLNGNASLAPSSDDEANPFANATPENVAEIMKGEIVRLRSELERTRAEADILKKALGIVSKE